MHMNDAETLPDLVLPNNMTLNEANTTEDEDEAAEALLQLSKSDTLPDDDSELPLGLLPVDVAPVPITLGEQDILNAIENFKQDNGITSQNTSLNGVTATVVSDQNALEIPKGDNSKKENNDNDKKKTEETIEKQSGSEPTPPTSPTKGSLVIIKHGIWRKRITKRTYNCMRCDKRKNRTREMNRHY